MYKDCVDNISNNNNIIILINMTIVQYLIQFSGSPEALTTHFQHYFTQVMVIQLLYAGDGDSITLRK